MDSQALDAKVRHEIYRYFVARARPPVASEVADTIEVGEAEVEASYRRLAEDHALVLAPGTTDIWMAHPLSAVPTSFVVTTSKGARYYGNCIWDGLGVLAMLQSDGVVGTICPDCDEPLSVEVAGGALLAMDAVVHYAVPAARWWDDIGDT